MPSMNIASSIASLANRSETVVIRGTKYAKDVRGEHREVKKLLGEVRGTSLLLRHLYMVTVGLEEELTPGANAESVDEPILKLYFVHECQRLLDRLYHAFDRNEGGMMASSDLENIQTHLQWPFSSWESDELVERLQLLKSTINLALAAGSLKKLKEVLSEQVGTDLVVKNVQQKEKKIIDIKTTINIDSARQNVLNHFNQADPRSEFEMNQRLRHPSTCMWLIQSQLFRDWYHVLGSRIWFTGITGAGKSVLSGAVIVECLENSDSPERGVGYFFCTYRNTKTHDPINILSSLASQLSRQNERAYDLLEEYYDGLITNDSDPGTPTLDGMIETLTKICDVFDQVHLVIDGVDECGTQVKAVANCLSVLASNTSKISTAVFSRDEASIRRHIGPKFATVDLEAQRDDIKTYLSWELDERIRQRKLNLRHIALKQEILTRIVDQANGMFRWVTCQLDYMCELPTDKDRRRVLQNLPPTLTKTYERILMEVEGSSPRVKRLVQRTLKIISATEPLHIQAICEAVSVPDDSEDLEDAVITKEEIIKQCGGLVRKSNDGNSIEYAHLSVFEFLRDACPVHPHLRAYGTSGNSACDMFDSLCLRFLTMSKFDSLPNTMEDALRCIKERMESHPFYEEAAIRWLRLMSDDRPPCTSDHLFSLFAATKTSAFSSWAITLVLHWINPHWRETLDGTGDLSNHVLEECGWTTVVSAVTSPDFTPLHMAAALGLGHVCDELIESTDVNLMSALGTPLHFAIGSRLIFDAHVEEEWDRLPWNPREGKYPVRDARLALARRNTVRVLLEKGARTDMNPTLSTWPWPSTLVSLAIVSSAPNKDFEVVSDLIRFNAIVDEDDLGVFYELYNHIIFWDGFKEFNDSILNMLQALESTNTTEGFNSHLYKMTLEFSEVLAFDAYQVEHGVSDEFVDDDLAKEYLYQITRKSDVGKMAKFLRGPRAELVKSVGFSDENPSWTLLHCAAWYGSTEIMRMLLEAGCDPNQADEHGKTPLHLCKVGHILQVLIQFGGSPFITDNENSTVWDYFVYHGKADMLRILLQTVDKEKIAQMEQVMDLPLIDLALERSHTEVALLLLSHNNPEIVFQHQKSIYRPAAKFNSLEFVKQLIELGVLADGVDEFSGSPLHHLSDNPDFGVVQVLAMMFPLDLRRKKDNMTCFELAVLRAADRGCWLSIEVCLALLPEDSLTTHSGATELWIFLCEKVLWAMLSSPSSSEYAWLQDLFIYAIESGIARLFEEGTNTSALIMFAHHAIYAPDESVKRLESLGPVTFRNVTDVEPIQNWKWISAVFRRIARESNVLTMDEKEHPVMIAMLIESIIHNDDDTIDQLLQLGVSVHGISHNFSPLEIACFPHVHLSEANFDHILGHASVEMVSRGNEAYEGHGLLHFTAGNKKTNGSVWKLQRLLQSGLNCDLPVSKDKVSPLVHHIINQSVKTAELLIDHGADLWVSNSLGFDAPLAATWTGNQQLLARIHMSTDGNTPPQAWDHRWESDLDGEDVAGGNALHMAAIRGRLDCIKYYLDEGLLTDLDVTDAKLQTPAHYAALLGKSEIVEYLESRGANINATSISRETPLHLAAKAGHLDTIGILLQLGAIESACSSGYTPLVYAYISRDASLLEMLQSHRYRTKTGPVGSKELSIMADGLSAAILNDDLDGCQMWRDLGCPLDIELQGFPDSTPLCKAIVDRKSLELVEWLLYNGANVAAVLPNHENTRVCTALEATMSKPRLIPLLPILVSRYFDEGGNFPNTDYSPIHIGVENGNIDGILMVLEALQDWEFDQGYPILSPDHRNTDERKLKLICTAVNQKDVRFNGGTPLHIAARENDVEVAEFLIDNMADINARDIHDTTPLFVACASRSTDVAKLLLRHGAQIDTLSIQGETPHMAACRAGAWEIVHFMLENFKISTRPNHYRRNSLSFMLWAEPPPPMDTFLLLLSKGFDLHQTDLDGFSTIHWLVGNDSPKYLEAVLERHAGSLLWRDVRWPVSLLDQVYDFPIRALTNISKKLPLLRKYLNDNQMRYISDLAFPGKHTLVCQAACWGIIDALENFIQHGADVKKVCPEHGSLLQAAASNSRLETVRFLVRSGVPVPQEMDKLFINRLAEKRVHLPILLWLLQGRYLEQSCITFDQAAAETKVVNWSGIITVRVPSKWEWRRSKGMQSTLNTSLSETVVHGGSIVGSSENSRFIYIVRECKA